MSSPTKSISRFFQKKPSEPKIEVITIDDTPEKSSPQSGKHLTTSECAKAMLGPVENGLTESKGNEKKMGVCSLDTSCFMSRPTTLDEPSNRKQPPSENSGESKATAAANGPTNLFARFAFGNPNSKVATIALPRPSENRDSDQEKRPVKKQRRAAADKSWVRMKDLSTDERLKVVDKWNSLLSTDEKATINDLRYEMLVSALLHARCQEPTVRQALKSLRKKLNVTVLSASRVAIHEPEDIAGSISCLQFYSTKAKYVVQASRQIVEQFGGVVPETSSELQTLMGIGEIFSDLLANVNTIAVHRERRG